jgi:hypothetical protein
MTRRETIASYSGNLMKRMHALWTKFLILRVTNTKIVVGIRI